MEFKGISANRGQATGALCIVQNANEFEHCQSNSIVLLNKVKPNAILAAKVQALLAIGGGITSHAAIVAREHGKPCVVGLPEQLLTAVQDGVEVSVDAEAGLVTIV